MSTQGFIPSSRVEIAVEPPRARIRHALLDLDGTVSLLRDGWQDQMVPLFVDTLAATPRAESREAIERLVVEFVDKLTGKQTIYQMLRLCEEIEKRGGTPDEPLAYKRLYNQRLAAAIATRIERVRSRQTPPATLRVPGSFEALQELRRRGVRCYLASGTDEELVKEDCRLLEVAELFDGGIHGALEDYQSFSKAKVIARILEENSIEGANLLVIGDGFVEIENAVEVGAVALGVHTREANRYHMNADKRGRLLRAGAHLLAPDLTEAHAVFDWLEI